MSLPLLVAWAWIKPILTNKWVLLGIAAALVLWNTYHRGYDAGSLACEQRHAAAVQHETKRIQQGDAATITKSTARTADDTKHNEANHEIVRYVYLHAHEMPEAAVACITPDVTDRLRAIH